MMTIDRIDTPNSKAELQRKGRQAGFDQEQRETQENNRIDQNAFYEQPNLAPIRNRPSRLANWLSQAWRMLTNSQDKDEG
ncbi:MAG: hypothetical protein DDG59_09200 [Anaerolineae bacterium]|jgi:hypothetical protein|nr:MAG: hypothetical protein DDG59_09200 [Anaerolineae bacterium]